MKDVLASLHDATVVRVSLDAKSGVCRVDIRRSPSKGGDIVLRVDEVELLTYPRQSPWGRSSSINDVRLSYPGAGVRVELELQSGDTISIDGSECSVASERIG